MLWWAQCAYHDTTLDSPRAAEFVREATRTMVEGLREQAAEFLPLFSDHLHGDPHGNAWIGSYASFGWPPASYQVVTREGEWLGWVDLPPGFTILAVGSDVILGVEKNELAVTAVAAYRIEKGEG